MKKILFATTALAAGAFAVPQFASAQSVSASNADFTFGGYARYGLAYDEGRSALGLDDTFVTHRFRLQIDALTESDAGVQFGARVRINRDVGATGTVGVNGVRYFVRSGGLEVGVGNIFGALENMPGQYPIDLGLTGLGYDYTPYNSRGDAYSSGGIGAANSNGIEAIYKLGDFSVHASASDTFDRRAIVGAYSFSGYTFALGVQDSDRVDDNGLENDTEWTASVGGEIGPAFVSLAYADNQAAGDQWVLAGRFDVGAATNIEAYIADRSGVVAVEGGSLVASGDSYGIDFNHNMGGGTSIRGGVAKEFDGDTVADLGVRFDF